MSACNCVFLGAQYKLHLLINSLMFKCALLTIKTQRNSYGGIVAVPAGYITMESISQSSV